MSKFAFVILHYNTVNDTKNCVKSIEEKCSSSDYRIYIVDNFSPNASGSAIAEMYKNSQQVKVILNHENSGFAKGNNLGISEALKDGYSDFITVLNSDTKIIQNNFCELVENRFVKSRFAALGPTIFTPSGKTNINPGRLFILSNDMLNNVERSYKIKLFMLKVHLGCLLDIYRTIHLKLIQRKHNEDQPQLTENCLLHGCCLIFSSIFFSKFSGFDHRSFLYFEEEILYAHLMKTNLKTIFDPQIEIWHKEDGATDSVLKQPRKKKIFLYTNILNSISIYRQILSEYGDN